MAATASPAAPERFTRAAHTVALLDADPDLAVGLDGDDLALARRALVVPSVRPPLGAWEPALDAPHGREGAFALFVVDGLITREVRLAGRRATQLVGPGEIVDLAPATESLVPSTLSWTIEAPTTLAVLDDRFVAAARRWPSLGLALHRRVADQAARAGLHAAIGQLGRIELRVLAVLWHLAERWGVMTSGGVAVPLRLTHAALGRLVGAQRPTVTLALGQLQLAGDVTRREDGTLVLRPGSQDVLDPDLAEAPGRG